MTIIEQAAYIIKRGGLVAFPTETVYGLGANAYDNDACRKIFETKGRPVNNPLIVHTLSLDVAKELAVFNDNAQALSILWPGPLTMVLPKKDSRLAEFVTAGLDTVAIRLPAHKMARELLKQSGVPIAAPSANKSGRLSPTSYIHVKTNFGNDIFVIPTEGNSEYGLESTIIDLSTDIPTILRFGFITPELIEKTLGRKVEIATTASTLKAPGMMYSHYAPKTPLRINAQYLIEGEIGLSFGKNELKTKTSSAFSDLNLSRLGNLAEAAANLFAYLHILDEYAIKNGFLQIAIAPIPDESIGLAINDRIKRASVSSSNTGLI